MKKIKLLFSLLIIFVLTQNTIAQKISGKVIDASTGNPIVGASVLAKGSNSGTSTNASGVFTVKTKAGDVLTVSATGYTTKEILAVENITISLEAKTDELVDVVVIGTRGVARAKTETAVPIDVIKINQVGAPTAKMDLTSVLNMAAPSFNYNKQSGSDGADHVDLGTLRGQIGRASCRERV